MYRKLAVILPILALSLTILFISILRTAAVKYEFKLPAVTLDPSILGEQVELQYSLAKPGSVLPDHPLWPLKAARDKVWLLITTDHGKKADLYLLFSDKRLSASKVLFEKDKPEIAYATLTKAEKYLEQASRQEGLNRIRGLETSEFLLRLANASLKHRQVIEEILTKAPQDARPGITQALDYSKNSYEKAMQALNEKGIEPPENPFDED